VRRTLGGHIPSPAQLARFQRLKMHVAEQLRVSKKHRGDLALGESAGGESGHGEVGMVVTLVLAHVIVDDNPEVSNDR
jgi:hypothetical protein